MAPWARDAVVGDSFSERYEAVSPVYELYAGGSSSYCRTGTCFGFMFAIDASISPYHYLSDPIASCACEPGDETVVSLALYLAASPETTPSAGDCRVLDKVWRENVSFSKFF